MPYTIQDWPWQYRVKANTPLSSLACIRVRRLLCCIFFLCPLSLSICPSFSFSPLAFSFPNSLSSFIYVYIYNACACRCRRQSKYECAACLVVSFFLLISSVYLPPLHPLFLSLCLSVFSLYLSLLLSVSQALILLYVCTYTTYVHAAVAFRVYMGAPPAMLYLSELLPSTPPRYAFPIEQHTGVRG